MNNTYMYCKKIIAGGNYDSDDMLDKLDVFLLNERITNEQYNELIGMITPGDEESKDTVAVEATNTEA